MYFCFHFVRWALKQEKLENLGQWKHSAVTNPEWNKLAYSWPILEDGSWNDGFDWPMEGYFIAYAPPLKKGTKGDKSADQTGSEKEGTGTFARSKSPQINVWIGLVPKDYCLD